MRGERLPRQTQRGRESRSVAALLALLHVIEIERIERPCHHREAIIAIARSERLEYAVAIGAAVVAEVAVEIVEGVIGRVVDRPAVVGEEQHTPRHVGFPLPIVLIDHTAGIYPFLVMIQRCRPVELGIALHRPFPVYRITILQLSEEIAFAQFLIAHVVVVDDGTGEMPCVVIVIYLAGE